MQPIFFTRKVNSRASSGFTLLEVLIVTGLLAVLVAVLAPRLGGSKNNEIKAVVRQLAVLSRNIRNHAKIYNATYRLVIEMRQEGDQRIDRYWVESAPGTVLGEQEEEEFEKAKNEDKNNPRPKTFQVDPRVFDKTVKLPVQLPRGMRFTKVELASAKKPFTEGRVYIYYLPQGFVEESVIQLEYEKNLKWTVAIRPLTGKADVASEHVDLADLRAQ